MGDSMIIEESVKDVKSNEEHPVELEG